jgi:hypothetical protein
MLTASFDDIANFREISGRGSKMAIHGADPGFSFNEVPTLM